ncbi:MAG: DUF2189 domain-containing protein [Burkholderiales bacterium]
MTTADEQSTAAQHFQLPAVREVDALRAFIWLARGWADFSALGAKSAFYGLCFAGMGLLILLVFRFAIDYTSTLTTGFMLVGPFLAIGLYDLSRQREAGQGVVLTRSLVAWRGNAGGIGIYVLILTVAFLVWARASLVTFALFEARALPTWAAFFAQLVALENLAFVGAFFGVGLFFAGLVFAFSAISIPCLLDRRADPITAAVLSIVAVLRNPVAMLVWAVLIVLLIGIGFATFYVGLIVTGPLVGHATWHAYRDLVSRPEQE